MASLFEVDGSELSTESFSSLAIDEVQDELSEERADSPPLRTASDLDKADGIDGPRRTSTETGRGRTQEITSSFKVIPQINYTLRYWHGLDCELDEWFSSLPDAASFLGKLVYCDPLEKAEVERELIAAEISGDFSKLLYFALGTFEPWNSYDQHRAAVVRHCEFLNKHNALDRLDPNSDDLHELSLIFVLVSVCLDTVGATLRRLAFAQKLMHRLASFRWAETLEIGPHAMLLRVLLLAVFGLENEMHESQEYLYKSCGAELGLNSDEVMATPLDYEGFREQIMARYPSYIPPEADPETKLSAYERPPPKAVMPNLVTVDVPTSIEEACELFHKKTVRTPEVVQFWEEQRRFLNGVPSATALPADTPESLKRVDEVYNDTLIILKSFCTVLLNFILQESSAEDRSGGGLHSACMIFCILLRWYRLSNIFKFEFLAAIMFDLQFHLIAFKYCANHAILETVLADTKPPTGFWAITKQLNDGASLPNEIYGLDEKRVGSINNSKSDCVSDGIKIESFSPRALEIFIALVGNTRAIISDKTQRIIIVAELPAESLKQLLLVYNRQLWIEALQIFKMQAPLNGKKWRSMNMELISAIYLHCPSKLNDNWLSGQDLSGEIKVAASQEETLRNMIEFYNSSRLNLEKRETSFFA
ncbi:Factor arrest protein 11 [Wickerhamiella sorbophila]|uniref:Factor arrest protein 11 n=1 Tax=Wickerhamiella sorbophila TaxID=45607 RepID=A0A2T0FIF2_9ASCO|nr:Factor arrest protein 11 [Wickerhamiella sorbophila]PRT54782.1 Factor arrest protein 11 [Wickerhamiella sorbophila]